jgi:hypothetical protein
MYGVNARDSLSPGNCRAIRSLTGASSFSGARSRTRFVRDTRKSTSRPIVLPGNVQKVILKPKQFGFNAPTAANAGY